jgi:hypothetical protein
MKRSNCIGSPVSSGSDVWGTSRPCGRGLTSPCFHPRHVVEPTASARNHASDCCGALNWKPERFAIILG